jgi:hypothetical protein
LFRNLDLSQKLAHFTGEIFVQKYRNKEPAKKKRLLKMCIESSKDTWKIRIIIKTFLFMTLILEDIAPICSDSLDLTISCFHAVSSKKASDSFPALFPFLRLHSFVLI